MTINARFLSFSVFLFLAIVLARGTVAHAQTTYCASDDGRRHSCGMNTRGGVQMTRQRSGSACIQGRTWGYDNRSVWVDQGCRAEFISGRGNGYGPGNGPGNGSGNGWAGGGGGGQTLYCASDDGKRNYCSVNSRNGVRMVRQRSGSACIEGRTWGYDRRGVWVDNGCRADFVTR
ncbi:MAG: DUF3011 domain-containing protein [Edaphobacter sp.]|uniref:DUF3011 domain-containing protein n=1 Tax=Edaphobacter sp. TaxID=1934404 RepID=UPI0023964054|nr:DUF3011 domain-containing protein [Edaphobacter sp.]MDE1175618.1 DUF3011 domain-containing protein [Edaphobacter sp.]